MAGLRPAPASRRNRQPAEAAFETASGTAGVRLRGSGSAHRPLGPAASLGHKLVAAGPSVGRRGIGWASRN